MQTEHMCFRAELLWRELGRKMTVCPKCEIAYGSSKKAKNWLWLAADATRKVVEKKGFRKCAPQSSHRPLLSFEFPIMSNTNCSCRSGVLIVVQKHWKTTRFRRFGPARDRCASGFGSDFVFGGCFIERSVLDRFCSEGNNKQLPLTTVAESGRGEPPTVTYRPAPETAFLAHVYGCEGRNG